MAEGELIIIFARSATPGSVKTRLTPCFTPEEAAEFHLACLADVVAIADRAAGGRAELHVAGDDDDAAEFRALHPGHVVRPQGDGGLGERLARTFEDSFERGVRRALIVGSDHPTLPPEHLTAALALLGRADVVFGPSRDGGYYAVAVRREGWPAARAVFHNIPWSTADVLQRSLERARDAALEVVLAPQWYDVDRPEDLELIGRDAQPDSASLRYLRLLWKRSGGCCRP